MPRTFQMRNAAYAQVRNIMASIVRYRGRWRAHIYIEGHRQSRIFPTKQEAVDWAGAWGLHFQAPKVRLLALDELRKLPVATAGAVFSGVYFLWDADQELAYIGQSRDIGRRLLRHQVEPPAPFQTATYMRIQAPWQLAIEQLYIQKYGQPRLDGMRPRIESYVPATVRAENARES